MRNFYEKFTLTYPGSPYDSVMADDFGGAYLATQHLIACGHQQIILLTGTIQQPTIIPSFQQRYWGYCAACSAAGISPLPPAVFPAHLDQEILALGGKQEGVQEWFRALVKHYSPRPTAFFGVCDLFALTALRVLQNLGWRIPEDFSVIGFDDYDISSVATPPLTTVHSYKKALAWVAVERLLARIEGEEIPPQYLTLGTDLIVKESTGLPPKMC